MLKPIILCVDDEKTVLNSLRQELEFSLGADYTFELAESAEEGLEIVQELMSGGYDIHVIISDQLMPGMKGDQFLIEVHKLNPQIRKILLTGQANAESVGNAVNYADLYRYIAKPWDEKDLRVTIEEAAKSYKLSQRLESQVKVFADLNRNSTALSAALTAEELSQTLLRAALTDVQASRGLLQLFIRPGFTYCLQATYNGTDVSFLALPANHVAEHFPERVLHEVQESQRDYLSHNALQAASLAQDPIIKAGAIRSLLAMPIAQHGQLQGILYLEQAQETRHFTPERVEYLSLLVRHAGICLANVLVYQTLEEQVQERTQVVEEKTRVILDSLEYARRIQYSLLPSADLLPRYFAHHWILYKPKDIVSGDFYWHTEVNGCLWLAAVDCTGHGVPGAFMSVLGHNLLAQAISTPGMDHPLKVLAFLHHGVQDFLRQYEAGSEVQDGMDLALIRYDKAVGKLTYASAHRPALLFTPGMPEPHELKAGRFPVGGSVYGTEPQDGERFSAEEVAVQPGQRLYLFSDGITDQFGGPGGRKYSTKKLWDLLIHVQHQPLSQHLNALEADLAEWQGSRPQTDDLLIIAMEF